MKERGPPGDGGVFVRGVVAVRQPAGDGVLGEGGAEPLALDVHAFLDADDVGSEHLERLGQKRMALRPCICAVIGIGVAQIGRTERQLMHGVPLWLDADGAEEGTVARSTVTRGTHAGEDVLFDDDPAGIANSIEGCIDSIELYRTLAEFTKYPRLECGKIVAFGATHGVGDAGVTVFEVDETDVWCESVEERDDVGIIVARAIQHVAGIEDEPEQVGVEVMEKPLHFVWRLDDTCAVMVERTLQAAGCVDCAGSLTGDLGRVDDDARRGTSGDATRIGGADGVGAVGVGQDDQGAMRLSDDVGGDGEECPRAAGVFDGRCNRGGIATQVDGDECADEGQIAALEFCREGGGLGGHEAPITEFGARVSGRDQFVEHLGVFDAGTAEICEFECAPRARGIGDGSRRHSEILCSKSTGHRRGILAC